MLHILDGKPIPCCKGIQQSNSLSDEAYIFLSRGRSLEGWREMNQKRSDRWVGRNSKCPGWYPFPSNWNSTASLCGSLPWIFASTPSNCAWRPLVGQTLPRNLCSLFCKWRLRCMRWRSALFRHLGWERRDLETNETGNTGWIMVNRLATGRRRVAWSLIVMLFDDSASMADGWRF